MQHAWQRGKTFKITVMHNSVYISFQIIYEKFMDGFADVIFSVTYEIYGLLRTLWTHCCWWEVLYRLANHLCCSVTPSWSVSSIWSGQCWYFWWVGGCHSFSSFICGSPLWPDLALLKVDTKNAFNECNRASFLAKVTEYFPAWTHWCYAQPAELHFGD